MERPPSLGSWSGRTEGLGGRVAAGNSPARAGDSLARRATNTPGAASWQPPHMSISHSICRTTSLPVYERPYSRSRGATTNFRRPLNRRAGSRRRRAGPRPRPRGAGRNGVPSSVCTLAASVTLDSNQTPCAARRSAMPIGSSRHAKPCSRACSNNARIVVPGRIGSDVGGVSSAPSPSTTRTVDRGPSSTEPSDVDEHHVLRAETFGVPQRRRVRRVGQRLRGGQRPRCTAPAGSGPAAVERHCRHPVADAPRPRRRVRPRP